MFLDNSSNPPNEDIVEYLIELSNEFKDTKERILEASVSDTVRSEILVKRLKDIARKDAKQVPMAVFRKTITVGIGALAVYVNNLAAVNLKGNHFKRTMVPVVIGSLTTLVAKKIYQKGDNEALKNKAIAIKYRSELNLIKFKLPKDDPLRAKIDKDIASVDAALAKAKEKTPITESYIFDIDGTKYSHDYILEQYMIAEAMIDKDDYMKAIKKVNTSVEIRKGVKKVVKLSSITSMLVRITKSLTSVVEIGLKAFKKGTTVNTKKGAAIPGKMNMGKEDKGTIKPTMGFRIAQGTNKITSFFTKPLVTKIMKVIEIINKTSIYISSYTETEMRDYKEQLAIIRKTLDDLSTKEGITPEDKKNIRLIKSELRKAEININKNIGKKGSERTKDM